MPVTQISREDLVVPDNNATPFKLIEEDEKILLTQPNILFYYRKEEEAEGVGRVYVTSKRVVWLNDDSIASPAGFAVDFRSIVCHAISRTPEDRISNKGGYLYCQLDTGNEDYGSMSLHQDEEEDTEPSSTSEGPSSTETPFEMRFCPSPSSTTGTDTQQQNNTNNHQPQDNNQLVDQLYQAFSEGALLNPDPQEEGEGEFIFNEDEVHQGNGVSTLQHLEDVFQMPSSEELDKLLENNGQFADPDEDEEEHGMQDDAGQ